jgi:hypothetical protein
MVRVVWRCLAKDAADRFPDSEGLERALGECACVRDRGQGRAARRWRDVDWAPDSVSSSTTAASQRSEVAASIRRNGLRT